MAPVFRGGEISAVEAMLCLSRSASSTPSHSSAETAALSSSAGAMSTTDTAPCKVTRVSQLLSDDTSDFVQPPPGLVMQLPPPNPQSLRHQHTPHVVPQQVYHVLPYQQPPYQSSFQQPYQQPYQRPYQEQYEHRPLRRQLEAVPHVAPPLTPFRQNLEIAAPSINPPVQVIPGLSQGLSYPTVVNSNKPVGKRPRSSTGKWTRGRGGRFMDCGSKGLGSPASGSSMDVGSAPKPLRVRAPAKTKSNTNMKQPYKKYYANPQPSAYCHVCARTSKAVQFAICARIKEGLCRKVICNKCFGKFGWDWDAAQKNPDWVCVHCRGDCPEGSQCFVYTKVNKAREKKRGQHPKGSVVKAGRQRKVASSGSPGSSVTAAASEARPSPLSLATTMLRKAHQM